MKKCLLIYLMSLMLISSLLYADATSSTTSNTNTKTGKPVVLNKFLQFILTANDGNVSLSGSDGNLTLKSVTPNVTYFTNRPRRIVGTMTTEFYLKRWIKPPPHDFKTSPPNAALVFTDLKNMQMYTNVVILKDPKFVADKNSLRFTIQLLNNSWQGPKQFKQIIITMAEVTVCGILGSWGNLPGEPQSDVNCHQTLGQSSESSQ